ncbi:MAG TPA: hypothetical protein VK081_15070, partial [Planctomycetota bacterium]|nr:hypothetical protein [Planctomycetota bacterium]
MRPLSGAIALAVFVACCWRAATQALTHDEALTWQLYVAGPFAAVVLHYDANHHVLHTLLCRASAAAFGDGELALRVPALLAAAVYLLVARRLTVGQRADARGLLAFGLLAANPFVLDYFALARGYGLALAAFFASFDRWLALLASAQRGTPRYRIAFALGALHAATLFANLAFAVPVAALAGTGLVALCLASRTAPGQVRVRSVVWRMALPAGAVALVLAVPLLHARMHHFYFGMPTLFESARTLVAASLDHRGALAQEGRVLSWATAAALASALLLGAGAVVVMLALRRRTASAQEWIFLLATSNVLLSALMWGVLHAVTGVPWPRERTGLALAPCFLLGAALGTDLLARRRRALAAFPTALLAGVLACFLVQPALAPSSLGAYRTWRGDTGAARVHAALCRLAAGRQEPVPVFVANFLAASLTYYELRHRCTPPLILHGNPEPGVRYAAVVVNPTFIPVGEDDGDAVCTVPGLGPVRGRIEYADPGSGVVVLVPK